MNIYSGLAILYVVLIHSNTYYTLNILKSSYQNADILVRVLSNIIGIAVPMFIFISGYKYSLNNKNENYKKFAYKKIYSNISRI